MMKHSEVTVVMPNLYFDVNHIGCSDQVIHIKKFAIRSAVAMKYHFMCFGV